MSRVVRSNRAQAAVICSALSSIGAFTLTVAVARQSDGKTFGEYALAGSILILVTGLIRAGITEVILAKSDPRNYIADALKLIAVLALAIASITLITGWLLRSPFIMLLALIIPGLTLLDFSRTILVSIGNAGLAVTQDAAWMTATIIGSAATMIGEVNVYFVFAWWGITGSIVGCMTIARMGRTLPRHQPSHTRAILFNPLYTLDYLAGSGSAQLAINFLAAATAASVVGAIRGAATLLSPVNLVASAARPLLIAAISRGRRTGTTQVRTSVQFAVLLVVATAPIVIVAALVPDQIGRNLLGATWATAEEVVLPLGLEALLGLVTGVAFAGHRAFEAGSNILAVRICLAIMRISAVVCAGSIWGVVGAAWAMPIVSGFGSIVWWGSYLRLVRRSRPPIDIP